MGLLKRLFGKKLTTSKATQSIDTILSTLPAELQQEAVLGCLKSDVPLDKRQFDLAIQYLKERKHPTVFIADILADHGEVQEAFNLCVQEPDVAYHIIDIAKKSKEYQAGIDALTLVLESKPEGSAQFTKDLGDLHFALGNRDQAHSCYRAYVDSAIAGDRYALIGEAVDLAKKYFGNQAIAEIYLSAARRGDIRSYYAAAQMIDEPSKRTEVVIEGLEKIISESFILQFIYAREVDDLIRLSEDERVVDILEKGEYFSQAAELSLKFNLQARAAENLSKRDDITSQERAGDIFYKLGNKERAVRCYLEGREHEKMLDVLVELKDSQKIFAFCNQYLGRDYGEDGANMLEKGARYASSQNLPEKMQEYCTAGMKFALRDGKFSRAEKFARIMGKEDLVLAYEKLAKI